MNDERMEKLRKERSSSCVALLKYKMLRSKHQKNLICVFEGNDDIQFYQTFFNRRDEKISFIPFNCEGKDNVLKLRELLKTNQEERSNNCLTAFFIDKDFDGYKDYQPGDDIYCTPTYSIENILVGEEILKELIQGEFHCNNEDGVDDVQKILNIYRERLGEFKDVFFDINLLIYYARTERKKLRGIERDIRRYAEISIDKIEKKYDENTMLDLLDSADRPDDALLFAKKETFSKLDPIKDWRGKFLYQFFIKFLSDLKCDRGKKFPKYFKKKKKMTFNPDVDVVRALASIAEIPVCLNAFLNNLSCRVKTYIENN